MADTQVKNETELTDFDGDEVFYLVDDPAGTPADRKAQLKNTSRYFGSPRRRFYTFNDCAASPITHTGGEWGCTSSGTGAAVSAVAPGSLNALGIVSLDMGTTTTGRAAFGSQAQANTSNPIKLGSGRARFQGKAAIHTLSTGTETYTARIGLMDVFNGDSQDGVYFRYTESVNGGKWQAVCRSNFTETASDTGITVVADEWHRFFIDVNAGGTSAAFYIDEVLVQTITTNIPTGSGRETGYGAANVKSAGTTATSGLYIDWMEVEYLFTTAR